MLKVDSKTTKNAVLIVLLILNTLMVYKVNVLNKNLREQKKNIGLNCVQIKKAFEMYSRVNFDYSNEYLANDIVSEMSNNLLFSKLTDQGTKLFLRIDENHCNECVVFLISQLTQISEDLKKEKIFILASYQSKRQVSILLKNLIPDSNILILKRGSVDLDKFNMPYCFLLNKEYRISNIFFPDKTLLKLTGMYFNNFKESALNSLINDN